MPGPVLLRSGQGRVFMTSGSTPATMKVEPGAGDFAVFESMPPSGAMAPPHLHRAYDEAFYILAGEMTFDLAGQSTPVSAGSTVFVPRGAAHGFANRSGSPARMLVIVTPRAAELIESFGSLTSDGPPEPAAIQELFAVHNSLLLDF